VSRTILWRRCKQAGVHDVLKLSNILTREQLKIKVTEIKDQLQDSG
jgi:hypothetical protein